MWDLLSGNGTARVFLLSGSLVARDVPLLHCEVYQHRLGSVLWRRAVIVPGHSISGSDGRRDFE